MLYELRIDVFVDDQHTYTDVIDKLHDIVPAMKVIHPCEDNQQCSVIDLIENHHDESPNGHCIEISHWDNCPVCT